MCTNKNAHQLTCFGRVTNSCLYKTKVGWHFHKISGTFRKDKVWENSQGKSQTRNRINIPSACKGIARNNIMTVTVEKQCILTAHRNTLPYLTSHQNALVLVKAYTARHKCACCIYDCVALPGTILPLESAEQFPSCNICSNIHLYMSDCKNFLNTGTEFEHL